MRIAWAGLHFGEEPPLTGEGGSGTVFFSGCSLRCAFCQNYQISQEGMGLDVQPREFADIALRLQAMGAANLNLVTPGHFIPSIIRGIGLARAEGLALPVLWNSSGYESVEGVEALAGTVDVWLPDLKTLDPGLAGRFFGTPDYPEAATAAILAMASLSGPVMEGGLMKRGTILRHLVIPGRLDATRAVLAWFAEHLRGRALLSLMSQYTPILAMRAKGAPARQVDPAEHEAVLGMLEEFGLEDGFYQELVPGQEWLPDFGRPAPFSSELARPLWHWKGGFLA
jgi:putative pyruvate formate lyase activating enzyme